MKRYLTKLSVFRKEDQLSESATTKGFELRAGNMINIQDQRTHDKMNAALKSLVLRGQHVIVQFWSSRVVGKDHHLTTIDQPFGVSDERLISYRLASECKIYDANKDDDEEEDISPLVRVFKQGLPEWSLDVTKYLPKHFPQKECAIRCNLQGYLAVPVFDPTTRLCVGVLELLMSSKYAIPSFHYEVQQIQNALKEQGLTCLQVCGGPAPNIDHKGRQNDLHRIFDLLKVVCDTHRLPLAQTWALSPSASVVFHEQVLTKSCNHYDRKCLGKVCMSTVFLPVRVQDLGLWRFRDACKAQHLDMSRGLVGKALSYGGSCFCVDVTKLSEEEYPLVHHARKSRLTSCFAIYMRSIDTNIGYVLEFFLPLHREDSRYILKQQVIEIASGFDLDDTSPIQYIGPLINTYVTRQPYIMPKPSVNVSDTIVTFTDANETSNYLKQDRKRKRRPDDTRVIVSVTYGENIKSFKFPISWGLWKLKKEVAKRFKQSKMIRLKYRDEENDLILICGDYDLEPAMVASGSKNCMNLICELPV